MHARTLGDTGALALLVMAASSALAGPVTPTTTVKVLPATSQVRLNGVVTFTTSGVTATPVMVWRLLSTAPNSLPDSSGALGTIDAAGHYKAPAAMPAVNTLSVQFFDSSKSTVLAAGALCHFQN